MTEERKKTRDVYALLILAACIAAFLLVLHSRISHTIVSPFFDGLNYVEKGMRFWQAVDRGEWVNPLNIEPSKRPPGTVLMSYPAGFSEDPRGFFYRSVAIPLVIFLVALWIAGTTALRNGHGRVILPGLCLALATLPFFYHFEPQDGITSPVFFGLVDGFLAAWSALALALIMKGFQKMHRGYLVAGCFLSGFTLMIKPSGILVMAVIALAFGILALGRFGPRPSSAGKEAFSARSFLLTGLAGFVVFCGFFIAVSLNSDYLSEANLSMGRRALNLLKTEWVHLHTWPLIGEIVHNTLGWHWVTLLCAGVAFSVYVEKRGEKRDIPPGRNGFGRWSDVTAAGVIVVAGLWFWLVATGVTQIRYFFPFYLMAVTLLVPRLVRFLSHGGAVFARILTAFLCVPFGILTILLIHPDPPLPWMRAMGVNLTTGAYGPEVAQAEELIGLASAARKDLTVYALSPDFGPGIFEGVGYYRGMTRPGEPTFRVRYPTDWIRDTTYRFPEILRCGFLLFKPVEVGDGEPFPQPGKEIPDFEAEKKLFGAWLREAGEAAGLRTLSETSLCLVLIEDAGRFADALRVLLPRYSWRLVFREANGFDAGGYTAGNEPSWVHDSCRNVLFGSRYRLRAACFREVETRPVLHLAWESLDDGYPGYTGYVHCLDEKGTILESINFHRAPPLLQTPQRESRWYDHVFLPRGAFGKTVEAVALCLKGHEGTLVESDGCMTDWGGKRLCVWTRQDRPSPLFSGALHIVTSEETRGILTGNLLTEKIFFGDRFLLVGAAATAEPGGLRVDFVWRSLECQALSYVVFLHILDGEGTMMANADYRQSAGKCAGPEGMMWHDVVHVSRDKLKGAEALGMGLYRPPGDFLPARGGKTDWDGKRLLLPLPAF